MKILFLILLISISSCSKVDNEYKSLIGHWTWHVEDQGFGESGFVKLNKDKTYTYLIESWNPTEKLALDFTENNMNYWHINNESICFSNSKNIDSILENNCIFQIKYLGNSIYKPFIKGIFLQGEIELKKVK